MRQLVLLDPVALLKENTMLKAALKTIAFQAGPSMSHEIAEKALSLSQDWGEMPSGWYDLFMLALHELGYLLGWVLDLVWPTIIASAAISVLRPDLPWKHQLLAAAVLSIAFVDRGKRV